MRATWGYGGIGWVRPVKEEEGGGGGGMTIVRHTAGGASKDRV